MLFKYPANLLAFFYAHTGHNYAVAIALMGVVVILLLTPLTLKSTKGMLEMQRLQPEMKRLQQQYRGDRQKLNEEMMKLYQEHKVNPLASCLPLVAQLPVFFIMFRVIRGLTYIPAGATGFQPKYVSQSTELYKSLVGQNQMLAFGLDLSKTPREAIVDNLAHGLIYALLVVILALLYWVQQRQIASRQMTPTMSAGQQKLMQYLPIGFAVFQIFLPTGLVIYYISQTILRIGQQHYITKRFYHGEGSLGKQAQEASARARDLHKNEKSGGATAKGTPVKGAPAKGNPAKGAVNNRPEPKKNQGRPLPTKNQTPAATNQKSSNQKSSAGQNQSSAKSGGSNQKGSAPQRNGSSAGGQQPASRHPKPTKKK
jgi:YidC/Oxa1 family membrane protein insertase